jgi:hypothetical protein
LSLSSSSAMRSRGAVLVLGTANLPRCRVHIIAVLAHVNAAKPGTSVISDRPQGLGPFYRAMSRYDEPAQWQPPFGTTPSAPSENGGSSWSIASTATPRSFEAASAPNRSRTRARYTQGRCRTCSVKARQKRSVWSLWIVTIGGATIDASRPQMMSGPRVRANFG